MPTAPGVINSLGFGGLPLTGTNFGGAIVMTDDGVWFGLKNNSGVALQYGTVIVSDVTGLLGTTSTTAGDLTVIGVIDQQGCVTVTIGSTPTPGVPIGGSMMVRNRGVGRVLVNNGTAVTALTPLQQSGTAGQATGNATAITVANAQASFAIALEAYAARDTFNTIRAKLV